MSPLKPFPKGRVGRSELYYFIDEELLTFKAIPNIK
jgi:hypothetical protein